MVERIFMRRASLEGVFARRASHGREDFHDEGLAWSKGLSQVGLGKREGKGGVFLRPPIYSSLLLVKEFSLALPSLLQLVTFPQ